MTDQPFTPGRYVLSWCDAKTAKDPIALTSQAKYLRVGLAHAGHTAALLLIVVADGEQDAAVARIVAALDAPASTEASPADSEPEKETDRSPAPEASSPSPSSSPQ